MSDFIDNLEFTERDPATAHNLDSQLIVKEEMKDPGPDRFPADLFKRFHTKSAPLLHGLSCLS